MNFAVRTLDAFVVMPNHFHSVLLLHGASENRDIPAARRSATLSAIVGTFKSISTIQANRSLGRAGRPLWQRNYYEHIVRDEGELSRIRHYIAANPARWAEDEENPENWGNRLIFGVASQPWNKPTARDDVDL